MVKIECVGASQVVMARVVEDPSLKDSCSTSSNDEREICPYKIGHSPMKTFNVDILATASVPQQRVSEIEMMGQKCMRSEVLR